MRTTLVSTSKLQSYKTVTITIIILLNIIGFSLALVPFIIYDVHYILIFIPIILFVSIKWYIETRRLKSASYDENSVFYEKNGSEVQIPFEDIKDIKVKGVNVFSISLFRPTHDGKRIWFKTSIKYPFNFKKQDEKLNELRDRLDRFKRTLPERDFVRLSSYNITVEK